MKTKRKEKQKQCDAPLIVIVSQCVYVFCCFDTCVSVCVCDCLSFLLTIGVLMQLTLASNVPIVQWWQCLICNSNGQIIVENLKRHCEE